MSVNSTIHYLTDDFMSFTINNRSFIPFLLVYANTVATNALPDSFKRKYRYISKLIIYLVSYWTYMFIIELIFDITSSNHIDLYQKNIKAILDLHIPKNASNISWNIITTGYNFVYSFIEPIKPYIDNPKAVYFGVVPPLQQNNEFKSNISSTPEQIKSNILSKLEQTEFLTELNNEHIDTVRYLNHLRQSTNKEDQIKFNIIKKQYTEFVKENHIKLFSDISKLLQSRRLITGSVIKKVTDTLSNYSPRLFSISEIAASYIPEFQGVLEPAIATHLGINQQTITNTLNVVLREQKISYLNSTSTSLIEFCSRHNDIECIGKVAGLDENLNETFNSNSQVGYFREILVVSMFLIWLYKCCKRRRPDSDRGDPDYRIPQFTQRVDNKNASRVSVIDDDFCQKEMCANNIHDQYDWENYNKNIVNSSIFNTAAYQELYTKLQDCASYKNFCKRRRSRCSTPSCFSSRSSSTSTSIASSIPSSILNMFKYIASPFTVFRRNSEPNISSSPASSQISSLQLSPDNQNLPPPRSYSRRHSLTLTPDLLSQGNNQSTIFPIRSAYIDYKEEENSFKRNSKHK